MYADEAFKSFGLLSVGILVVGLTFLVVQWPQGKHATFSGHAAARKTTILYYAGLFAIALPLLSIFFIKWFVPTFHLSVWFIVCALASEILQHSVTIIPEVGGWKTRWHQILTTCSAVLLLPMLGFIAVNSHVSLAGRACAAESLVIMAALAGYLAIKKHLNNQLLLQALYYGVFFVTVMMITYRN